MSASVNAILAYFKVPIIWINGIVAALGVLAVYFMGTSLGPIPGICTALVFLLLLPFFFAGTYGVILDGNKKKGAFLIYARYGYPRCLSPTLIVFAICLLLYTIFGTIGLFICLPILFFTYLSDITAIRHNLKAGQAIKDSAARSLSGSILTVVFFLGNIIACVLFSFALDLVSELLMPLFVSPENITSMTALAETASTELLDNMYAFTTIDPAVLTDIANQFLATPGLLLSIVTSFALMTLIFMPFFVAYKAYFFRDLLLAQAAVAAAMKAAQEKAQEARENPQTAVQDQVQIQAQNQADTPFFERKPEQQPNAPAYDPHAGEDGEYDAKGRWFKYK